MQAFVEHSSEKFTKLFKVNMRNIQEKLSKVLYFIQKSYVNFPEFCSVNACVLNS